MAKFDVHNCFAARSHFRAMLIIVFISVSTAVKLQSFSTEPNACAVACLQKDFSAVKATARRKLYRLSRDISNKKITFAVYVFVKTFFLNLA